MIIWNITVLDNLNFISGSSAKEVSAGELQVFTPCLVSHSFEGYLQFVLSVKNAIWDNLYGGCLTYQIGSSEHL